MTAFIKVVVALGLAFLVGFSIARTMNVFASNGDACTTIASQLALAIELGVEMDQDTADELVGRLINNHRITGSIGPQGRNLDINGLPYDYEWNDQVTVASTRRSFRFPFRCQAWHRLEPNAEQKRP